MTLTTYTPQTDFTGYQLGLGKANIYIAIPDKYWKNGKALVMYEGKSKYYHENSIESKRKFPDKFRKGEYYVLCYVKWRDMEASKDVSND